MDNKKLKNNELILATHNDGKIKELQDLMFAWKVAKFVKSNAIVYVKDKQTIGIGAGQMSRVISAEIANLKAKKEGLDTTSLRESEIESFISGLGLAKKFNKRYGKNLKTHEIFKLYRQHDLDADRLIDGFKINLAMSLSTIVNILDPDAFVFGGGLTNEIDFFDEIENLVKKNVIGKEYEGVFLKPKYGDASGVRGAARLGRKTSY